MRTVGWMSSLSEAAISNSLKRLGLSCKQAQRFVHSPDPHYVEKWQAILAALAEASSHPQSVQLLFGDEMTYYRSPTVARMYHPCGQTQPRIYPHPGPNTQTRLGGALNAVTGQVTYHQCSRFGAKALIAFAAQLRQAYPNIPTLYLVLDNWPTHKLPEVLAAFTLHQISLLFLPTYASWLNPIEKLWRYLRQKVLHAHSLATNLPFLRQLVRECLDQFANGSQDILHYVGLC